MTIIAKDTAVKFNYTLKDDDGNILDQSPEGQPLAYLHGHSNIIPGLEQQLEGKSAGERINAVVEPVDGYGEYQELAVQKVPRDNFQGVEDIQAGMQFQSEAGGQVMLVTVTDVNDDEVTVDANHPLAGKRLTFDVEIQEVRAATEDELNHGHVHGAGGVEH